MTDRFYGKTWIPWAQFIIFGLLGATTLVMGVGSWTGVFRDADQRPRPDAGPPLTAVGSAFCLVALLALARIIFLKRPLIRLYREGLEVGPVRSGRLRIPGIGGLVPPGELTWNLAPAIGFKAEILRFPWDTISRVAVSGPRLHQAFIIEGIAFCPTQDQPPVFHHLRILNANLRAPLEEVRDTIVKALNYIDATGHLSSWS